MLTFLKICCWLPCDSSAIPSPRICYLAAMGGLNSFILKWGPKTYPVVMISQGFCRATAVPQLHCSSPMVHWPDVSFGIFSTFSLLQTLGVYLVKSVVFFIFLETLKLVIYDDPYNAKNVIQPSNMFTSMSRMRCLHRWAGERLRMFWTEYLSSPFLGITWKLG